MADRTSSAERTFPRPGLPVAALLAGLIVLAVELVFRLLPAEARLGYGTTVGAYYDVRHTAEDLGAAELTVVGTSHGREALVMPELRRLLAEGGQPGIRVGNSSCPGASALDLERVVRTLVAASPPPRTLVYVVEPRILHGEGDDPQKAEIFGVFPNELGGRVATVLAAPFERPLWAFRNALGRHYLTFRHRYRLWYVGASLLRGRPLVSPVLGELTEWQAVEPERSLVNHPVSPERLRAYMDNLLVDGRYPLGADRIAALDATVAEAQAAGVRVVFLLAPLSAPLREALPPGTHETFLSHVQEISRKRSVDLVDPAALGLSFDRSDFREQSHLNLAGATRLTRAFAAWLLR